jgi:hypothetical protein
MSQLIEQYFQRDLTEAEAEALERELLSSPESAALFNERAEAAYLATGLPAHQWPGKPISIPKAASGGLKLILAALALGAGVLAWVWYSNQPSEVPVPKALPLPQTQPAPVTKPAPKPFAPKAKAPRPQDLEADQLNVLVETPQSSLVTIRVLDAQGREVRALFAGVLEAGQKTFRWDGLLADGRAAPAGEYNIQVQNGSRTLLKKVRIETR